MLYDLEFDHNSALVKVWPDHNQQYLALSHWLSQLGMLTTPKMASEVAPPYTRLT